MKYFSFFLLGLASAAEPVFHPQSGGVNPTAYHNLHLPYDLARSQTILQAPLIDINSFWIASFCHATNGHDYAIVSQLSEILPNNGATVFRASILDITDTSSEFSQFATTTLLANIYGARGVINATLLEYGMGSTTQKDGLTQMRAFSSVEGVAFDITWDMSSPALLNNGLGTFPTINGPSYEWSMPAGRTQGWIQTSAGRVDVVPEKSLTWFDRQWGGLPRNFTWFQVNLPGSADDGSDDVIYSIWTIHDKAQKQADFATTRVGASLNQTVVPVTWSLAPNNTFFKSPHTGMLWPQSWIIEISGGPKLYLNSVKPDQEAFGLLVSPIVRIWSGFLEVEAVYPDGSTVTGWGLADNNYFIIDIP